MLLRGFHRPRRLLYEKDTLTDTYGRFYAEPFERGFGTTLGNALRRVLLSSIEGAGISAVKIKGVLHEFSSLPGVVDDTIDIITNLKKIPFRLDDSKEARLHIKAKGTKEVTSADIEAPPEVEIVDTNCYIASLSDDGELEIEMILKKGRGYVEAEENFDEELEIGYIPIDSVHSPVRKVHYRVEDARLGRVTDYDRLILEIWTNGTITPTRALSYGGILLQHHLALFIDFEEEPETQAEQKLSAEDQILLESLRRPVEELELSVRSQNCLKNANVFTIADLVRKTKDEMLETKNFGKKSLEELDEVLKKLKLELGMSVSEVVLEEINMAPDAA